MLIVLISNGVRAGASGKVIFKPVVNSDASRKALWELQVCWWSKILELQDCLKILYGRSIGVSKADVKLKGLQWDLVLGWFDVREGQEKPNV